MGNNPTFSASILFFSAMDAFVWKYRLDELVVPTLIPLVQNFPPHIIHKLSTYHWDYSLYYYYQHIPVSI